MEIGFIEPQYLWFFLSIPFLIAAHAWSFSYNKKKAIEFANFEAIARIKRKQASEKPFLSIFQYKNLFPLMLKIIALSCLILAMSGLLVKYESSVSNFDFIVAIDISSSMLSEDLEPNRLEAAKQAALLFTDILSRGTHIGIVAFSGTSFVEASLTDESNEIKNTIRKVNIKNIGGTDIGSAIVTSTNLLKNSENAKAIILLTDGQSNVGIMPEEGIAYANKNDIIIHTIGIGTASGAMFKDTQIATKLDEATLQEIAEKTGGRYYRTRDVPALEGAFKQIADFTRKIVTVSLAPSLLLIGILLLVFNWILINTKFRIIP